MRVCVHRSRTTWMARISAVVLVSTRCSGRGCFRADARLGGSSIWSNLLVQFSAPAIFLPIRYTLPGVDTHF